MYVSLNHRLEDTRTASISIWNGGFLYGDGVYTTLRLYRGIPLDLEAHWERLSTQAADLELPLPTDLPRLATAITELAERNGMSEQDGRLRVTLSRGGDADDPLPLTGLQEIPSTLLMTLARIPADLPRWQQDGIDALVLDAGYSRGNVPELKTLNTLPAILAQREAARAGCQEAILTAQDGRLLEGAISNLFLVRGGELATPAVGAGFLAGLTRTKILELAVELGLPTDETDLYRQDLAGADEAFVVGSVRELLPVIRVDGRSIGRGRPGPVTRTVQEGYRRRIAERLKAHGPGA